MPSDLLVDINIFEDILTKRKDWEASFKIWRLLVDNTYNGWISSLTKPVLYFLSVKKVGEEKARKIVNDMTRNFAEISLTHGVNHLALEYELPEYEDNIQIISGLSFRLDGIVTRNKKHFLQDQIPVYSPEEILAEIKNDQQQLVNKVPFLDLKAQYHQVYNEIDDKITDIISRSAFILGNYVEEFEKEFARAQEAKYCIGVSSGTDALHLALLALDIGPGNAVFLPVNTFFATAEAVFLTGATPVFVDIDPQSYHLDSVELEKAIQETVVGSRVSGVRSQEAGARCRTPDPRSLTPKGIIPVHLYGQPADMDRIMDIAQRYGLEVVEDCAQSHQAAWQGIKTGNFGEFGAFSFYPGKNLGAFGEAGALVTNDFDLYSKAKSMRGHGESRRYHHQYVGHNYRMENFQGAALSTKLKYLPEWTRQRQEHAAMYSELLQGIAGIQTPVIRDFQSHAFHLYVVRARERDSLQAHLESQGVATGLHYPVPLHLQEACAGLGYTEGDFAVAEQAAQEILSLPMFPELTREQVEYVCGCIWEFYKE